MSGRRGEVERRTAETDVRVQIDLDGTGAGEISTGIGFLDHMLTLFARHGRFDLVVAAAGDLEVDGHHTTEDVAIVLGEAVNAALGDKRGIARYGHAYVPMDEVLVRSVLDLSGRPFCAYDVPLLTERVGTFDTEMGEHFCRSFAVHARLTLHVDLLRGGNTHHVLEAVWKSLALALSEATRIVRSDLPSTKETL